MKNRLSWLSALGLGVALMFPPLAAAQPATATQDSAPAITVDTAAPAMWRVRDADSDYVLLGTFHILPPALDWRSDLLDAAFDSAETVYFEADPDDLDEVRKVVEIIKSKGVNAPGVSLFSILGGEDAKTLGRIARDLGLKQKDLEPLRPWNAFLALGINHILSQGYEAGAGVDRVLVNQAKISGKKIRYFETLSQQIEIFAEFSPQTERDLLLVSIRHWEDEKDALANLLRAWAQGDVDYIDTQMNDDMREQAPAVYERLIVERNLVWAEELDAALKNESGKGFVAVGAAHLVGGEFSVPALLAAKGYDVTRYGIESVGSSFDESAADENTAAANDNTPTE